jgi:hypothetical protein
VWKAVEEKGSPREVNPLEADYYYTMAAEESPTRSGAATISFDPFVVDKCRVFGASLLFWSDTITPNSGVWFNAQVQSTDGRNHTWCVNFGVRSRKDPKRFIWRAPNPSTTTLPDDTWYNIAVTPNTTKVSFKWPKDGGPLTAWTDAMQNDLGKVLLPRNQQC